MIRPVELQIAAPMFFGDLGTTTSDVWETLVASRNGDTERVKALAARTPVLACCSYNYAPPIHFAVREGHLRLVRFLVEHGGLPTEYGTDLFRDSLVTMASERGHVEIAQLLAAVMRDPRLAAPCIAPRDRMRIAYSDDEQRVAFRDLLESRLSGRSSLDDVEAALLKAPALATDDFQYWGEGVLSMPAKEKDRELVELLMQYGARVLEVSKWCGRFYFKDYDMAAFLLERGMSANHMTWQHVTLLHEMAHAGDLRKAALLLDHGARIDAIDEEYCSTPLGLAARQGHRDMVALLLERGADRGAARAEWATPLAWAKSRGHASIEDQLRIAGAL